MNDKKQNKINNKVAFGITSLCQDGSHIFMSDIDEDISIKDARNIYKRLIDEYGLSNVYVVKSSNGYNAFSLDKIPLKLVYELNNSVNVFDSLYNHLQFSNRGFYTLRIGADKKVVDIVHSGHHIFVRSNAHRIFFNSVFGLNISKYPDFDNFEVFQVIRFLNGKHGVDL